MILLFKNFDLQFLIVRHQCGLHSLACDEEASFHYGIQHRGISGWLWHTRCYLRGFLGR